MCLPYWLYEMVAATEKLLNFGFYSEEEEESGEEEKGACCIACRHGFIKRAFSFPFSMVLVVVKLMMMVMMTRAYIFRTITCSEKVPELEEVVAFFVVIVSLLGIK